MRGLGLFVPIYEQIYVYAYMRLRSRLLILIILWCSTGTVPGIVFYVNEYILYVFHYYFIIGAAVFPGGGGC